MAAELDNKRLHAELLILRSQADAANADCNSARAGAEKYEKEMLREQKQVAATLAELEKLKKQMVQSLSLSVYLCKLSLCRSMCMLACVSIYVYVAGWLSG